MGNRKLPFGYQMRMGEIIWNEPEAKAVQDIFLQYTLGSSLKEIAEQMSKTGPSYDEGKSWNKIWSLGFWRMPSTSARTATPN